jgi:hypothetical protein
VLKQGDDICDVNATVVVGICGIGTRCIFSTLKQVSEQIDRISDIDLAIGIDVTTQEVRSVQGVSE